MVVTIAFVVFMRYFWKKFSGCLHSGCLLTMRWCGRPKRRFFIAGVALELALPVKLV